MVSKYIPEDNYYVEENINFINEKPGQHHVNQVIELQSPMTKQVDIQCLLV